ncbi:MAG: hypothetical protein L6R39_000566 [Caloplaca ligustica]|nr:MAG: hypothetical protein L6R39_000566 [Caloplaca ligustica]
MSKSGGKGRKHVEWTDKLASSLDHKIMEQNEISLEGQESLDLALRLEGPYFSPADPSRYHTVVCLVAGTGISGAIAIAGAFCALQRLRVTAGPVSPKPLHPGAAWRRCIVIWSVREKDYIDLPCLERDPELDFRVCLTGPGRPRQDMKESMERLRESTPSDASIWTYISGPSGFIEAAKTACKGVPKLDYHAASWEI